MKKIYLFSTAVLMLFAVASCSKDDQPAGGDPNSNPLPTPTPEPIAQEQQAVAFYLSGVWCGPCGYYGKPAMKNMTEKYKDDFVVISCQLSSSGYQDPFNNPDANRMAQLWNVSGVPTAAVGGNEASATKVGGGSSMETGIDNKISSILSGKAITNSRITKTVTGDEMKIKVETKFFEAVSDEYYISTFILEDNLIDRQYVSGSGWQDPAEFDNILRRALEPGTAGYGVLLNTEGAVKANKVLEKEYTTTLDPSWKKENIKVAVVVWKKGPNGVVISNGVVK